jgi:hypothetical protein
MTEQKLGWGAHWLLPDKWSAAWGARAIADEDYKPNRNKYEPPMHVASLLADRQSGAGKNEPLGRLLKWINENLLPIKMLYNGSSTEVTIKDDGEFHARWTPNGSHGYIYIVAWMD